MKLSPHQARVLFPELVVSSDSVRAIKNLTSGPSLALKVMLKNPPAAGAGGETAGAGAGAGATNVIAELFRLAGPENPVVAREDHPKSLRALFGLNAVKNAVHVSAGVSEANRELSLIFDQFTATQERVMLLIKSHAIARSLEEPILQR